MVNSVYSGARILVFSILLIPVCGVFAKQNELSWRVKMPVIQPVEKKTSHEEEYVADLKRPVSNKLLRVEAVESVVDGVILYVATISPDIQSGSIVKGATDSRQLVASDSSNLRGSQLNPSPETNREELQENGSVDLQEKFSSGIHPDDPLAAPSVSLMPNGNEPVKSQRSAQDVSFYTTPKRAVGLSGFIVKAKPSLSVIETYDSNIDYKNIDDLVTEIKPALTLDVIGGDTNFKFRGDFIYRTYLNHKDLDRYDYNISLYGKHKFSPKVDSSVTVTHKRRHNLDQNTYDAGGVDLDPTIILTTTVTPELNWRIGEKDNLNFALNVDKTDYERDIDSDYLSNVLSTVWGHALDDERTTLYFGAMNTYTHYSREIDSLNGDQVSMQGVFGIDHQLTPALKLSFKGGPGFTVSNYSSDANRGDDLDFLYQFRFEVGYREFEFSIVPAIERIVRPGRYGENEVVDQAELYYRYEFSEYFTYDMINTYWMIEADGVQGGRRHKSTGVFSQSILNWIFEEDWNASFGLSYNHNLNEISNKVNERVKTWVGLSYSFPTEIN